MSSLYPKLENKVTPRFGMSHSKAKLSLVHGGTYSLEKLLNQNLML